MGVAFMSLSKNSALAAGGGRMGGSDFSSSSSSSSSLSSPSSSSSSSWSSPSSSSSSRSSRSSSRSYYIDDDDDNYYNFTPSYSSSSLIRSSRLGGDLALVESVGTANPPLITQPLSSPTEVIVATLSVLCVSAAIVYIFNTYIETTVSSQTKTPIGNSILTLQIGVLGSAKSLQKEFNRIAKTADTSKKAGLTYILTETTSAVLRHPDYCISAYSSVDVKSDMKDVEMLFMLGNQTYLKKDKNVNRTHTLITEFTKQ